MTLYILDTNELDIRKKFYKSAFVYMGITLLCYIFFLVYTGFSHGVSSVYMTYLFLVPFLLGTVVNLCMALFKNIILPGRIAFNLYNSGIAAFTLGSLIKGILDIAGTMTHFQNVYWFAGIILEVSALIYYVVVDCMKLNGGTK